ncbi:hypothetical protein GE09DRAFT_334874 [Coniochaeta sp. 2T2.1]|nr:hypothetical protein GE09DRAFT_334874 [Coniochaeta sp. 2T2.1]
MSLSCSSRGFSLLSCIFSLLMQLAHGELTMGLHSGCSGHCHVCVMQYMMLFRPTTSRQLPRPLPPCEAPGQWCVSVRPPAMFEFEGKSGRLLVRRIGEMLRSSRG